MNSPVATSAAHQWLTGTDMAAFTIGLLAVLYAALWLRDRERGMPWLAASFALLAVYTAANDRHLPQGPLVTAPGWGAVATIAIMLMTVGIVEYLGTPQRVRRWALALLLLPGVVLLMFLASGTPILRSTGNAVGTLGYVGTALLCFGAARRERGAGHVFIGLALLAIPGGVLAGILLGFDTTVIRYFAAPPLLMLGLTFLTVSLLRRRRALEAEVARRTEAERALTALNVSLEDQVAQRTSDLQNVITGLESFNRSVSHDLRGPLGGIAELTRLGLDALERGDNSLALRLLPEIATQADTSARLVAALLDLAHVSDSVLHRAPIDLQQVAGEAVNQLVMADPARPMPAIEIHPLPTVDADADLLRPVFINLIGNAVKFVTGRNDPHIDIGATSENGQVTVYVRDNGVGFDSQAARRLFQPFVRLHGRRYEGHGVGLSIVRRAVERHGGRVWAEAVPDQGACFYFTLPRSA